MYGRIRAQEDTDEKGISVCSRDHTDGQPDFRRLCWPDYHTYADSNAYPNSNTYPYPNSNTQSHTGTNSQYYLPE